MLCYYLFFVPIGCLTLNLRKLFCIQWMIILVARAVWELQALFAPGHIPPCIPHLTTGRTAAGEEAEGEDGISKEGVVDQGGVVPDPENHGMVAEVRGDQGIAEALGEVVGHAPQEVVDMEFLVGLCLEDEYGTEEEEHGEEEHGEKYMGKRKG